MLVGKNLKEMVNKVNVCIDTTVAVYYSTNKVLILTAKDLPTTNKYTPEGKTGLLRLSALD